MAAEFKVQELAKTVWAFAVLWYQDTQLFGAISVEAHLAAQWSPQEVTDISWSFAKVMYRPTEPIKQAIASKVAESMPQFAPGQLANTAWACAELDVSDERLLDAITSAASTHLAQLGPLNLERLLWSVARREEGEGAIGALQGLLARAAECDIEVSCLALAGALAAGEAASSRAVARGSRL